MPNLLEELTIAVNADVSGATGALDRLKGAAQDFGASLTGVFEDVVIRGASVSEAINRVALSVSRSAFKASLKPLQGELTDVLGPFAPSLSRLIGAGLPAIGFARGGVFDSPALGLLAGPRLGVIGEAGPEAVLPLTRGRDGRLGVRAEAAAAPVMVTFNVQTSDAESFRRTEAQVSAMLARAVDRGRRNS